MNVRDLIKKHEGLRLTPYRCSAGYRTIGWGHNLDAAGEPSGLVRSAMVRAFNRKKTMNASK